MTSIFKYITPKMEMHEIIEQNNKLLLLMEHFNMDFTVGDNSIEEFCNSQGVNSDLFIALCNLYNGSNTIDFVPKNSFELNQIVDFLENTHKYYLDELYPEIKFYISKLSEINDSDDMKMVEKFFESYFSEIKKHLAYEHDKMFPMLKSIISNDEISQNDFDKIRKIHHGDVETKLSDLKNLMLKHLHLVDKKGFKRKLLTAIFEFQFDLNIHSIIEDKVLSSILNRNRK